MRFRFTLSTLLLFCLMSLPAFAQWQWGRPHEPSVGACFYMEQGFRGNYFCLKEGDRWPSLPVGFNDRITSIRVFNGARLRVFNDDNFGGISALINHDVYDLRGFRIPEFPDKSWNDRISSIAVFREHDDWERHDHDRGQQGYQGQPPSPGRPPFQGNEGRPDSPRAGACFYADSDFRGNYFCMKEGERSASVPPGFNDAITSIRVFGGVRIRIFNDGNFGGFTLMLDHDVSNLKLIPLADVPFKDWNDRISSIAVFRDHDDWERRDQDHGQDRPRY